tara:strand:- start:1258 stop:3171 length:1914 start_codon:yes stop_codon:yes gene_type:complete
MIDFKEFLIEMDVDQQIDVVSKFIDSVNSKTWDETVLEKRVHKNLKDPSKIGMVTISSSSVSFRKVDIKQRLIRFSGKDFFSLLSKSVDSIKDVPAISGLIWYIVKRGSEAKLVPYAASKAKAGSEGKLGNATDLFEQVAARAFIERGKLDPDLTDPSVIDSINQDVDKGSLEFTTKNWEYYIGTGDVKKAILGVNNYISKNPMPSGEVKIIHQQIKSLYYPKMRGAKIEKNHRYAVPDKKENTADIALLFGSGLKFEEIFSNDYTISSNTTNGYLPIYKDGYNEVGYLLQVSLKIDKSGSQVGKGGTDYKPFTYIDGKSRKSVLLDKWKDELKLEGFVDFVGGVLTKSWNGIKKALGGLLGKLKSMHKTLVGYLAPSKMNKEVDKRLRGYASKFNLTEGYLVEKVKQDDIVNAIIDSSVAYSQVCEDTNDALQSLRETLGDIGSEQFKVSIVENLNENIVMKLDDKDKEEWKKNIRYLLCNQVAFETLDSFYSAAKRNISGENGNIFEAIAEYTVDMAITTLMGESKLPVVKLYGTLKDGDTGNWEILSRDDSKYVDAKNKVKNDSLDVGGVLIGRSRDSFASGSDMGYYTVQNITLASYENDKPTYNKIQLRTGGSSGGFSYSIEANKEVHSVDF